MKTQTILVYLLAACLPSLQGGPAPFSAPPASHAKTYPAHESHDDEMATIAVDPFDRPEKAKIFKVNYRELGFLPVRLILSNDGDTALTLSDLKVEFITVKRQKIEPATSEDIYRVAVRLKQGGSAPGTRPPSQAAASPSSKEAKEIIQELDAAQFVPGPVDPHSTRSGFLFFDVRGIDGPEAGAHVYISGLKAKGKELFYFDIPLDKYLSH